ncbi:hypothetical protein Goklo_024700 [Gossypium klotzschianum]|uniref:RNase H type-1 domain-containing protein n=1 Tax=Gossypium klotzschianum TaxID=34286 RepID=A0A7J8WFK3_9ROSI|nr:hypothetical protein [Gossypium klotzschianum]
MHVMVLQKSIGVRDLAQNIQRHLAEFQAFDSRTFSSATGLVGWDLRGNLMVLKTVIHRNVPSPFAAEAYACLEATSTDKSVIGAIIRDIQKKKADFQELIFQYIHRSENTYAHRLAKTALEKEETYLRGEDLEGHAFASAETWLKEPD